MNIFDFVTTQLTDKEFSIIVDARERFKRSRKPKFIDYLHYRENKCTTCGDYICKTNFTEVVWTDCPHWRPEKMLQKSEKELRQEEEAAMLNGELEEGGDDYGQGTDCDSEIAGSGIDERDILQ